MRTTSAALEINTKRAEANTRRRNDKAGNQIKADQQTKQRKPCGGTDECTEDLRCSGREQESRPFATFGRESGCEDAEPYTGNG